MDPKPPTLNDALDTTEQAAAVAAASGDRDIQQAARGVDAGVDVARVGQHLADDPSVTNLGQAATTAASATGQPEVARGVRTATTAATQLEQVVQDPSVSGLGAAASTTAAAAGQPNVARGVGTATTAAAQVETFAQNPSLSGLGSAASTTAAAAGQPAAARGIATGATQLEQVARDPSLSGLGSAASTTAAAAGQAEAAQGIATATTAATRIAEVAENPVAEPGTVAEDLAKASLVATESLPAQAASVVSRAQDLVAAVPTIVPSTIARVRAAANQPTPSSLEDIAEAVVESILGSTPIHPVRYEFSITVGPDLYLRVRTFGLTETLGDLYELRLELIGDDPHAPTDELLGAECEVLIDRHVPMRALYGIVHEVEDLGSVGDRPLLRVRIVPALRLLEHEIDTRIFQGLDVKQILTEVLTPALAQYGRTFDAASLLKGEYNKRDYCVQFRESNLAFCRRLMEEEGIAFVFEPDESERKEKLVLIDNNNDYGTPTLVADTEIPVIQDRPEQADRESFQSLTWRRARRPNKVSTSGYNEKAPRSVDESTEEAPDAHHPTTREVYLHDERRQIVEDVENDLMAQSFTGENLAQREPIARMALERWVHGTKVLEGRSNVTDLRPGVIFTLGSHPLADLDGQRFLVIGANHVGDAAESEWNAERQGQQYANTFQAIPADREFRPEPIHSKPQLLAAQTATVVGPPGEEIHCDRFGRILVRFHWDRLSETERSSCWLRVVQPWAGPGWGFVFIPRVGMEVVVTFLDGNPDRPVVMGCVYNGDNMPPYALPEERTKSVIKTSSSPGGNGYNEFTFEDAAGAEQIILHAQKDFNETVENDHNTTVHANQTIAVDGDQSNTISGNRVKTVVKNEDNKIDGHRTFAIKGDDTMEVKGHTKHVYITGLEQKVTSNYVLEIADVYDVKVKGQQKVYIDGTSKLTVTDTHTAVATNAYSASQADAASLVLKSSEAALWGESKAAMVAGKANESSVVGESSGKLVLSATQQLTLVCGAASIVLSSDGKVAITGTSKVEVTGGASALKLDTVGAQLNGPMIKSAATAIHEIKGAVVMIN